MSENSQQITSLENRISFLEAKVKELELRLSQIESPTPAVSPSSPPNPTNALNKLVSITLISKNFHQADYNAGDSGDRINFTFQFANHLKKDIRAFTGVIVFKDLFEKVILKMGFTDESGIRANSPSEWKGGMEYNQFTDEHRRLLNIARSDLIVEFVLNQVIYTDGTREAFNEQ